MSGSMRLLGLLGIVIFSSMASMAQTATWVGATNDRWRTASNWSPAGVPDETTDVIINYVPGNNQCTLRSSFGVGKCKSLTIGTGAFPTVFTEDDGLYVYGNLTIGANGTFTDDGGILRVEGNWINNGTYTAGSTNRRVYFIGANQTISGSTATTFEKLYINSGSRVTLAQNITVSNFIELDGTLDPTAAFMVTVGTNDIDINSGGELIVKAATYGGNYSPGSAQTTSNNATVNYASTTVNQIIDPTESYEILKISGSMTKSLSANINVDRDLIIEGGTLDLQSFTANRNSNGGSLTMAPLTTLKIGGTNTFPSNYSSILLATSSTVEYNGADQTVRALSYGHLTLSATGTAIKTMPGTAFTVAGNFTSSTSAGTLSYSAANNISVSGSFNIGASTVFTSTAYSHSFAGNWINNGIFNGCGSTITSTGAVSNWSGTGVNNFGNVVVVGNGTIVNQNTSLSLCGNFSTTGGGTFTHTTGGPGTFTMTGSAKTITGANIFFDDLIIGAGGSVSTTSNMGIAGDLTATGTLTATAGTVHMLGSGKTIGGAGALQFYAMNVLGTITTARNLSISSNLSVSGSYTASAGQTTFNGTSTLSGTANLFDVNLAPASSLTLGGSSTLGIAGAVTNSGTFNATSNIPNTVNYNGSGAQGLVFSSFNNLVLSNGNTKTPSSAITIGGHLTIGAATTLLGGAFSHNLSGNWINNGIFTSNTSTINFIGVNDAIVSGVTNFNDITINKGAANKVTLNNNINTVNLNMLNGQLLTAANSVTITNTRAGNGIIIGTIIRTHAFATGIDYAFEGPDNFINFSNTGTGVSSVTVLVEKVIIGGFPSGTPVNRKYTINVVGSGYTATLRLHYEQVEVNGNAEAGLTLWNDQGTGTWVNRFKSANNVGTNWVEQTGLTDLQNAWALSDGQNVLAWTGGGLTTSWTNPSNWTTISGSPGATPTINDIVLLGDRIILIHPIINSAAQTKGIIFGSVTPVILTLGSGGSLTVQGNIEGNWASSAIHTIIVDDRTLTTFSDLELSKGGVNRKINIIASSGTINVNGSLFQSGNGNITFTGSGTLNISKDYVYVDGNFNYGTSSVNYNGIDDQVIAPLTYYNVNIDKAFGVASTNAMITAMGGFTLGTSGAQLNLGGTLNVMGDITLVAGSILRSQASTINVGGNWLNNGLFDSGSGTVVFNGTSAQTVNATVFNNLNIDKASSTLTAIGNLSINGNINVLNGIVDVSVYAITRTVVGGSASLAAGSMARFGGAGLQISNFGLLLADPTSTIEFYGNASRPIPPVAYGNLIISGTGIKSMTGPTGVLGNLTINAGATLALPASSLTLFGNLVNSGTLDGTPGALVLNGTAKTITGGFTTKELIVNGEYDMLSGNLTINDNIAISATGDLNVGTANSTVHGNLTNSGALQSTGITTFTGLQPQTIQLNNAILSSSTGVVNFNGTVAPIFNSTSSPVLATVNINNTASINPSQPWVVNVSMNIAAGSTWNGGALNHVIKGNFVNNGTVTSSGTITFNPNAPLPSANITLGNNFTSTGTVVFGGTVAINLVDNTPVFESVAITNTFAAGVSAASNWIVSQNLFIGPGAQFNGGAFTHSISGEWTNNGIYSGGTSSVFFDSNAGADHLGGSGTNNFYDITFAAGAAMDVVADLLISRNFTNNASALDLFNGQVTFTGNTLSVLGGSAVSNFDELIISKTGTSVQMDNDVIVSHIFTLTNGILDLNAHGLSITDSSPTAIVHTGGYILSENTSYNSSVCWNIGNDMNPHVIPFGTSLAALIPFTFDLSTGDAGTLCVATYATGNDNLPLPPGVNHVQDAFGGDNSFNTVDRFFSISLSGQTTPSADVTLTASVAEVGTITMLQGQRWNGTSWDAPLPGQISGATSVTIPGVTQFSTWTMSGNSVPLPITLVSFKARQLKNNVVLEWSTASEINNDHFEIEKSVDGANYFVIGKLNGAGNSTESRTYNFSDHEIHKGRFFYRLKQVDFDKQFTYSPVVTVLIGETNSTKVSFNLFPNPTVETLFVAHEGLVDEVVAIILFDATGKEILRRETLVTLNDDPIALDMLSLRPGTYLVKVISSVSTNVFRVMKGN